MVSLGTIDGADAWPMTGGVSSDSLDNIETALALVFLLTFSVPATAFGSLKWPAQNNINTDTEIDQLDDGYQQRHHSQLMLAPQITKLRNFSAN